MIALEGEVARGGIREKAGRVNTHKRSMNKVRRLKKSEELYPQGFQRKSKSTIILWPPTNVSVIIIPDKPLVLIDCFGLPPCA